MEPQINSQLPNTEPPVIQPSTIPMPSTPLVQEQTTINPILPMPSPDYPVGDNESADSTKYGFISLGLGFLATVFYVVDVFTNITSTNTATYIMLAALLIVGVVGVFFGSKALKVSNRINTIALIGVIISVFVCMTTISLGSAYIKVRMEINSANAGD